MPKNSPIMTNHKILYDEHVNSDSFREDEYWVKTTHPNITYDTLFETFIVTQTNNENSVEVYGKDRFRIAIRIADEIFATERGN